MEYVRSPGSPACPRGVWNASAGACYLYQLPTSTESKMVCTYRNTDRWATIEPDGGIRLSDTNERFGKVDDAGREITQKSTCRGMLFWHIEAADGSRITLSQLRDTAVSG